MSEPAHRTIVTEYPESIAAAYQRVVLADEPRGEHDALLGLGHALLEHLWLVLRSEYVARRAAHGPDPRLEQTLAELARRPNVTWGDTWRAVAACWQEPRAGGLVSVSPRPRRDRTGVHAFVTTWAALKGLWAEHRGAPANLPYDAVLPARRADDKGATSLHRFFEALINCRNASAHRDGFALDDGPPVVLELGEAYYAALNPALRAALDELLVELRPVLTATVVGQVTRLSPTSTPGLFEVRLLLRTGLGAATPRTFRTDRHAEFWQGTRWLLGPSGSDDPSGGDGPRAPLRVAEAHFPAQAAPGEAPGPAPGEAAAHEPARAEAPPPAADGAPGPSSASERLARAAAPQVQTAPARLEDLTPGARVLGVSPTGPVKVESARFVGSDCVELLVERADGGLAKHLVFREREPELRLALTGRPWSFDGDPELFRLAAEAHRLRLAWYFDPYLAVTTSAVEPLPHQISAVYEVMLERQPLRFLLADDPGAGKTIMAGLLIKELIARGDLQRCLIVAPGSLVEQWQDELGQKFGLEFDLFTRDLVQAARSGNPFAERHLLIARLDQLSRSEELQERLEAAPEWDLVICDEAHRMSGHYQGGEVKLTKRYRLGELLGRRCRNLLLMSATPHNGKDEDFQLFMALLDGDRFAGRFRDGVHTVDTGDMMRRLVKEDLYRFDGRPLFPERRSYTVPYPLSDGEARLYAEVTDYVSNEMDRVARLDDGRRVVVGFALMTLQRRLASSPLAISRSLERRRRRLEERLQEERLTLRGRRVGPGSGLPEPGLRVPGLREPGLRDEDDVDELLEDAPQDEREDLEQRVVDLATAAQTVEELALEIARLQQLEDLARRVVASGTDAKWTEVNQILDDPLMQDGRTGTRRKLVVFTEFKDTLTYLAERIRVRLGREDAVVVIHGGVKREERRKTIEAFQHDPSVHVLVANDAAGEGVNLQRAHLMINYDLPWNPNRLEQRFGRIHRIGQTEVCHLWNLIAKDTREGAVFQRLLDKLEAERASLGGKVFDVIGELFDARALRDLLMEAIQYGDDPEVRARIDRRVADAVDHARLEGLLAERRLTTEALDGGRVDAIREAMERAHARRLQPHFVQSFFLEALRRLGGSIHPREEGRFEITRVPADVREHDRVLGAGAAIARAYERVCFDAARAAGPPRAPLVCPGHQLHDAVVGVVLARWGDLLRQGAVLVDERDPGTTPRLLVTLTHALQDGVRTAQGEPRVISERLFFVEATPGPAADPAAAQPATGPGAAGPPDVGLRDAGAAPYLDYRPATEAERAGLAPELDAAWLRRDWDQALVDFAVRALVGPHQDEVRARRRAHVAKVEVEVKKRLKLEINHWDKRAAELRRQEQAGKKTRLPAEQAATRATVLTDRLKARLRELELERSVSSGPPRVVGAALVVPLGLLRRHGLVAAPAGGDRSDEVDPAARALVERLAMEAVLAAERALGRVPRDVSAQRGLGYDVESKDPATGSLVFLEVKGRAADASEVTLTRSEILCALNAPDRFRLAIVLVDGGRARPPVYVRQLELGQPGFGLTSATYALGPLLARGGPPA